MRPFRVIDGGLSAGGPERRVQGEPGAAASVPRPWWRSCLAYYGLDDPRNLAFIAAIAAAWYVLSR